MIGKRHLNKLTQKEKKKNIASLPVDTNLDNCNSGEIFNVSEEENIVLCKNATLEEDIKDWVLKYHPSVKSTSALLHILKKFCPEIPLSLKTIAGARQMVEKKIVEPGSYFHIGIVENLMKIKDLIEKEKIKKIVLDIGIDGLPLFKSSAIGLWPILGRIVNMPMVKVFLIGSYVGKQKPVDVNLFLQDFVTEMAQLNENGLELISSTIKVEIRAFLCDAQARSFVCGVKGHNSLNGCSKCEQKGVSVSRVTTFSTSLGHLRSDNDFKCRLDQNFHQPKFLMEINNLEHINIKMITQFPLDVMHLIDLGVMKKMLLHLLQSKTTESISSISKQKMSSFLTSLCSQRIRQKA